MPLIPDYLKDLPETEVAAWYGRLADTIAKTYSVGGAEPLSATLLKLYLRNRDATAKFEFAAPTHLKRLSYVRDVLEFHRAVFLTEKRANVNGHKKWAGILPRLQGVKPFPAWNGIGPLFMDYESLVSVGDSKIDMARLKAAGTDEEIDIFLALRGFQLKSRVLVAGSKVANKVNVLFQSWICTASDTYDFDPKEHFTMPNPDFGSKAANAVRPGDKMLVVYHTNAQRIERKKLAAPYRVIFKPWMISNANILKPTQVDPTRKLLPF
jgi:hypothetical protein